jgi:hypothetical protein
VTHLTKSPCLLQSFSIPFIHVCLTYYLTRTVPQVGSALPYRHWDKWKLNITPQFPTAAARCTEQFQPSNLQLRVTTSTRILYYRFSIGPQPQMTLQMPCQLTTHLPNPQHLHPDLFPCRYSISHKAILWVLKTLWAAHAFLNSIQWSHKVFCG